VAKHILKSQLAFVKATHHHAAPRRAQLPPPLARCTTVRSRGACEVRPLRPVRSNLPNSTSQIETLNREPPGPCASSTWRRRRTLLERLTLTPSGAARGTPSGPRTARGAQAQLGDLQEGGVWLAGCTAATGAMHRRRARLAFATRPPTPPCFPASTRPALTLIHFCNYSTAQQAGQHFGECSCSAGS
jgi:hypothetical protein